MKTASVFLFVAAGSLSGCAGFDKLQQIPITTYNPALDPDGAPTSNKTDGNGRQKTKVGEAGAVYLWPPYSSAALIDGKGNRCVLAASGAKTIEASSEPAFKLARALEKIDDLEASVKQTLAESFIKISTADAHATFADVALFHLCLLDQNGTFSDVDGKTGELIGKSKNVMDAYLETIRLAEELP